MEFLSFSTRIVYLRKNNRKIWNFQKISVAAEKKTMGKHMEFLSVMHTRQKLYLYNV